MIIRRFADYIDSRVGIYKGIKSTIRKIFPDHWSFMLGEIALYSFIILVLTGIWLTLFFTPSNGEDVYHGSYSPLFGLKMSEAYLSVLRITFDVRGGLLIRQVHHWAATVFLIAIMLHMFRVFFTGAFRKPRELNWVIGFLLFILAIIEGFAGYSLPDDLLSGTGLRIASGILLSIPVIGTYAHALFFGGEFPGDVIISRLYTIHILLLPLAIMALLGLHLFLVFYQKHTQFPGAGRKNNNVVGLPLMPVYMAKAGGFLFLVFGVLIIVAGVFQINPIWLYGPYRPDHVSAGSQPDWYFGFLEGALRLMPNIELHIFGYSLSLNVFIPTVILPMIMLGLLALIPFFENWLLGYTPYEANILDRPRNVPTRTALGVAWISEYFVLLAAGGNDILGYRFDMSVNTITYVLSASVFIVPIITYIVAKRICLYMQKVDKNNLLHGKETGIIHMLHGGKFVELHRPLTKSELYTLDQVYQHKPKSNFTSIQKRLYKWYYSSNTQPITLEEYNSVVEYINRQKELKHEI